MYKIVALSLCVYLFSFGLYAQSSELDNLLNEIEKNNKELSSFSNLIESKHLQLKSTNNLTNPEFSFYYMPFGNNNTGAYTEFQLSQTFDFPTVYNIRKNLIASQKEQLEIDYSVKKQEVLLEAKKHYNKIIYLNKYEELAKVRIERASLIFSQVQKLFENGQIGILESNKANIVLIQEQFKLSGINNEKRELLLLLKNLNGGQEIIVSKLDFETKLNEFDLDSIVMDVNLISPKVLLLNKMETIAQQEIKLSKNQGLPNLSIGLNYQGVSTENYGGVYGGLSLPLWNNKNKVKAAKFNYNYHQDLANSEKIKDFSLLEKQYNEYQNNLNKYNEYLKAFNGLNSNALLLKAYEMGQISFMDYYTEIKFYEQAENEMLLIEYELNQLKADFLKYKL